ncbi:unnamed protein product [Brachionus calyciflorus]|uniref:Uncharacterized protein n=1 Tax=Brachionus calyciflorus TaxID=104777 RepID=A0A814SBU7_9BILA|nr:unnamed protein product [Brachionus calyciflorus]
MVIRNRATHKEIGVCTDPLFTPLINTPVIPEIRNHRERNYSSITIFNYIPNQSSKNKVEKTKVDPIYLSEDSSDSSSEYEKDYYEIFGTDSETESEDKLFIDEDKISSEEENEKLTNDEQMNGDNWISNEELELFAPDDDF